MTKEGVAKVVPGPTPVSKICGDADSSGTVDILDALKIAQNFVGFSIQIDRAVSDVNSDGKIDIVDALIVAQFTVRLISNLNC